MAVIQTGGGGGFLGTLGKIAGLGGMLIPGAQFLTPLGMGMSAIDAAMQGNPQGALQAMAQIAGQYGDWQNPASGSMAVPGTVSPMWDPAALKALEEQGYRRF